MPDNTGASHPERVSIVIPARNAGRTIDACLAAIAAHLPADCREVIVADNGSIDETVAIAERHHARIESVPAGFVSRVRNAGAQVASHSLIAFVDSDCAIRAGWHAAIVAAFANSDVGVAGRRHEIPDQPSWVEALWHAAHARPVSSGLVDIAYVPAGNLVVRRDVFEAVGGFDESLETGEDPDLCARVAARGYRVVESAEIRSVHLGEPKSLRDVFRRERWHGRGVRLRYANGRIAPVVLATIAFAVLFVLGLASLAVAAASGSAALAALATAPLLVPAIYAARYAGMGHPLRWAGLVPIYAAYFAGRAAALPVAFGRMLRRRS